MTGHKLQTMKEDGLGMRDLPDHAGRSYMGGREWTSAMGTEGNEERGKDEQHLMSRHIEHMRAALSAWGISY